MNEKRIEQVMQIENEAQQILDAAKKESARIPLEAEREGREIVERARAEAESAARQLIERASDPEDGASILADAEKRAQASEAAAKKNLDRAVEYVLARVLGEA